VTVLAIFKYDVKPDRMDEFMAKLGTAAGSPFDRPVMPQAVRLFPQHSAGTRYRTGHPDDRISRHGRLRRENSLRECKPAVEAALCRPAGFTRDTV
jgi:hypothetical protein